MANFLACTFVLALLAVLTFGLVRAVDHTLLEPQHSIAEASVTPSVVDPATTAPATDFTATATLVLTSTATSTPSPTLPPPPAATSTPAQVNRADCNQIRGTRYLSVEERSWYLSNCVAVSNRANCDQIRGTQYLSTAERNWYLINCT